MIIPNQLLLILLLVLEIKLNVIVMDDKLQQLIFFLTKYRNISANLLRWKNEQNKSYMKLRNYHFHSVTLCFQPDPNDFLILFIHNKYNSPWLEYLVDYNKPNIEHIPWIKRIWHYPFRGAMNIICWVQ